MTGIEGERLTSPPVGDHPLYEVVDAMGPYGDELKVAFSNFARRGKQPRITCTSSHGGRDQLLRLLVAESGVRADLGENGLLIRVSLSER